MKKKEVGNNLPIYTISLRTLRYRNIHRERERKKKNLERFSLVHFLVFLNFSLVQERWFFTGKCTPICMNESKCFFSYQPCSRASSTREKYNSSRLAYNLICLFYVAGWDRFFYQWEWRTLYSHWIENLKIVSIKGELYLKNCVAKARVLG